MRAFVPCFRLLVVGSLFCCSASLSAQDNPDATEESAEVQAEADQTMMESMSFDPGWIGLAGLLGLFGLMSKDRRDRTPTTTTVTREHGR